MRRNSTWIETFHAVSSRSEPCKWDSLELEEEICFVTVIKGDFIRRILKFEETRSFEYRVSRVNHRDGRSVDKIGVVSLKLHALKIQSAQ